MRNIGSDRTGGFYSISERRARSEVNAVLRKRLRKEGHENRLHKLARDDGKAERKREGLVNIWRS